MVYGETGRYPLEIHAKLRMLNFWTKVLTHPTKFSSIMYKLVYEMYCTTGFQSKWLLFVQTVLHDVGLSYLLDSQNVINNNDLKFIVKQILQDQFIQKWYSDINNSSRGQLSLF